MPSASETEMIARKLLPIIYVIDTSGSMAGERIASVNEAMHDTVDVLKEVSDSNPTAELKVGVMQFDSNAKWVTKGLIFMEDYFWNDLSAGGLTSLGAALDELDKKLSRKEFLSSDVGFKAPVIIFFTDGYPTDEYEKSLKKIQTNNKWFKCATKIGIGVGDDFDREAIARIVGNSEAVIQVNDTDTLKKLIRVVSVTASMVGSKSRTDEDPIAEIMSSVAQEMSGDTDIDIPVVDTSTSSSSSSASNTGSSSGWSAGGWDDQGWD